MKKIFSSLFIEEIERESYIIEIILHTHTHTTKTTTTTHEILWFSASKKSKKINGEKVYKLDLKNCAFTLFFYSLCL
jgi:uncharacterized protein (DUF2344 family)